MNSKHGFNQKITKAGYSADYVTNEETIAEKT